MNSDTAPSLVDFTGAMGTGTQRNIQIRYQHIVDAKQKLLFALEGGDVENKNVEGGSRFPALTMRYEFKNPDFWFNCTACFMKIEQFLTRMKSKLNLLGGWIRHKV